MIETKPRVVLVLSHAMPRSVVHFPVNHLGNLQGGFNHFNMRS